MRTKGSNVTDIFSKKSIERRGVSTTEEPLPKIHLNPDFEVTPDVSDETSFAVPGRTYGY